MSQPRPKKEILRSPPGMAANCYLHKPDTEGDFANNKFKTTIKWSKENPPEGFDEFRAGVDKLYADAKPKGTGERDIIKDGDLKLRQDGSPNEDFAGYWFMVVQTMHKPDLVGKGNKLLPESLWILSGDLIRVKLSFRTWERGPNRGLSIYLDSVKLLDKRNKNYEAASVHGGWDDDEGFDPADSPYVHEEAATDGDPSDEVPV